MLTDFDNVNEKKDIFQIQFYCTDRFCIYSILGIFTMGLVFAKFAISSKTLKLHSAKNNRSDKPYFWSPQIAKIRLSEKITQSSYSYFH